MTRRQLVLLCITLLLRCTLAEAHEPQAPSALKQASLKERLTLIPAGSIVTVVLTNKQKIRGRLGSISDSGFEVQHTSHDQVITESLPFDDVQSVKVTGKGMHFAIKVVIGTLIVIGVITLVGAVVCATSGCSS